MIDDTLSVWTSKEVFLEFFNFLNTIHEGIKWTNETEEDNKLNIFNIQIIRTEEGKYETAVYRKSQLVIDIFILPLHKPGKRRHVQLEH